MIPHVLQIRECKKCSRQFYIGQSIAHIKPDTEIEMALITFVCEDCKDPEKKYDPRVPKGGHPPF
jgi:hypothetical protein